MTGQVINSSRQQAQAMGNPTHDIGRAYWCTFFAEFTRDNRGAHARLRVLGPDIGRMVQIDNRPFDGVSNDVKDGEHAVSISFAPSTQDHFTHGIQNVSAVRARPGAGSAGAALEIVAENNTTTLLELSKPEAHEAPRGPL